MMKMKLPGDKWYEDIVIASCWYTDTQMALLLLTPNRGEYYKYQLWDMIRKVRLEQRTFGNIIPAASYYDAMTGCWGEDLPDWNNLSELLIGTSE